MDPAVEKVLHEQLGKLASGIHYGTRNPTITMRNKLLKQIFKIWLWLALGIILCMAKAAVVAGAPIVIFSIYLYYEYLVLWKENGYSPISLNILLSIFIAITFGLSILINNNIANVMDIIFRIFF